jgi:hypothetical protein
MLLPTGTPLVMLATVLVAFERIGPQRCSAASEFGCSCAALDRDGWK